jgi:hypothetical protein
MADYTKNAAFRDFAQRINEVYRDNSIKTKGARKYAVFPHGLREFYFRYKDEQAKEALKALHENPGYGYRAQWGAPWNASREMAYGLSVHVVAESVGIPRREEKSLGFEPGETLFDECVALVLGHFEQWFVSETARYVYPFMVGLSAEALIDYYEVSKDPEVPWMLQLAADKMYGNPDTWRGCEVPRHRGPAVCLRSETRLPGRRQAVHAELPLELQIRGMAHLAGQDRDQRSTALAARAMRRFAFS